MRFGRKGSRLLKNLKAKRLAKQISKVQLSELQIETFRSWDFFSNYHYKKKPFFFLDMISPESLKGYFPHTREVIQAANDICSHNFNLLGSGKRNVDLQPGNIDWHRDLKSGERWEPSVLYTDTTIIKGNNSDIKIPWELSRFQHLPTLGKAYWLTGNDKYAAEFACEILDWIHSNPPLYGVNWACTMDVAIRTVNWIWGFYFFKNSPQVTDEFLLRFLKSLRIHGKHIRGNLERHLRTTGFASSLLVHRRLDVGILKPTWRGIYGNHYLSDIVGLVYIGVVLSELKEARAWRDYGTGELVREMERQVYPDGVDYEGSISYHRLVTELFLSATLFSILNGVTFPKWYMERLEKMIDFVMHYTKPDGTAPQIGDNDDGRLHILANYGSWNRLDHRSLLSTGAVLFNRPDFKQAAGHFHEEAFWLLGEEGLRKFNALSVEKMPVNSKAFADGGFYIMRRDSLYMIVDCVPAGPKAPSGHKHNSRLSFELFAHNKSFIIDPGAYVYTADKDMRNLFRSTAYHNVVVVDNTEQSKVDPEQLFSMGADAKVKVIIWDVTKEYDILSIEHRGYERLKSPLVHRRNILFDKKDGFWIIQDILLGKGIHQYDLYFHFAPLEIYDDNDFPLIIRTKTEEANLAIIPLEIDGVSLETMRGWVSYRYGEKVSAPIVKYSKKCVAPTRFSNIIYPYMQENHFNQILKDAKKIESAYSKILNGELEC